MRWSPPDNAIRRRMACLVLLIAGVTGCGLRTWIAAAKPTLNHDEGISFLCASAAQGTYADIQNNLAAPLATWTTAGEFKRLMQPQGPAFGTIRDDLARHDIHPPLYFWLLHAWGLMFGLTIAGGPLLNTGISLAAMLALFGLTRYVLRDDFWASIASGIWFVSPAVIATCIEARNYDLLALTAILFIWAALRFADLRPPLRARHWLLLIAATAAGALTHYHFALPAIIVGGLLTWRLAPRDPKRLAQGAFAVLVGIGLFVLVHPDFRLSLNRGGRQAQAFDPSEFFGRVESIVATYASFFVLTPYNDWLVHKYLPLFLFAGLLGLAALLAITAAPAPRGRTQPFRTGRTFLALFGGLATVTVGLYLFSISPRHAMGPQYLAMVWPFLACLGVLAVRRLPRFRMRGALALFTLMIASGTWSVHSQTTRWSRMADPGQLLATAPGVVIDNVARGLLPCLVWHIPDDTPVYAAPQDVLLADPSAWVGALAPGTLYLSEPTYGATEAGQAGILAAMSAVGEARLVQGGLWRRGRMWRIDQPFSDDSQRLANILAPSAPAASFSDPDGR